MEGLKDIDTINIESTPYMTPSETRVKAYASQSREYVMTSMVKCARSEVVPSISLVNGRYALYSVSVP